jgi:ubiquinone/menaquinone biosynthesis C-methylase UbiE
MGFYRDVILPRLCDLTMRRKDLAPYRARVIGAAKGRVLEIGAGSGLNLRLYGPRVSEVLALEPDPKLIGMARDNAKDATRPVALVEASAEDIPLDSGSVDTVVTTWTLCTIPDGVQALREMRRVLKPGGSLLFIEHGQSSEQNVRRWQDRVDPVWTRISGGCHLNRPISLFIEQAGFRIERLEHEYLPGPKMMGFLYEGRALPH